MLGFTLASILAATFTGSAAAAFCIMAPLISATCAEMDINPSKVTFSVGLVCIAACGIIPVGGYNVQSQLKQSILPAILLSAINIFWVMTVYPL